MIWLFPGHQHTKRVPQSQRLSEAHKSRLKGHMKAQAKRSNSQTERHAEGALGLAMGFQGKSNQADLKTLGSASHGRVEARLDEESPGPQGTSEG